MSQNPLVSFVIRTKNEEVWLGSVLDKIYAQTYKPIEIIIVDSGSTDKTLEIIAKYPDVQLIQIKPEEFNYSYALNIGIKHSKGKYIGIFSGHSLLLNNEEIQYGVNLLESDTNLAALTGHYFTLPDTALLNNIMECFAFLLKTKVEHFCKYMTNTNSLIRKNLWEIYNFDENLLDGCEDYDWACEMISRGYDVVKDKRFSVRHSHHHIPNGLSWDERVVIWNNAMSEIDKKKRPSIL
jgi:rhamnosyltransferase